MQALEDVLERVRLFSPADKARVLEQVAHMLAEELKNGKKTPYPSLYGIMADLAPAASPDDIDEARREVWANFPHEDLA